MGAREASRARECPVGNGRFRHGDVPDGQEGAGRRVTISVSVTAQQSRVAPRANYPSAADAWTGSLIITSGLVGATATINVYAVCTV